MIKHSVWASALCITAGAALVFATPADRPTPAHKASVQTKAGEFASPVVNGSFEADDVASLEVVTADGSTRGWKVTAPQGWSLTGSHEKSYIIDADCYGDNNFGQFTTIADGSHALYLRMGWSTGSSTLSQTVKLPAGKYELSAMVRTAYANSASSSFSLSAAGSRVTEAFDQGSANVFTTAKWKEVKVAFTNEAEGDVTLSLDVEWKSGGSCIMVDNIRLRENDGAGEPVEDPTEADVTSPTEGVITHDFVAEAAMQADLMQMLADFTVYMKNNFQDCAAPNSVGEECGAFKAEGSHTMANNEQGVRPNADMSMICAFLVKYGKDKATLPAGITWADIENMARKSLVFSYSTHKANKLKTCSGNNYWGSVSNADHVWESSLWAMSVAYSAFFQWDSLSQQQRDYIKALLVAECNYELERGIPTGYNGDTKAEENGWEADVLAATLGLFPDHELAPKWFARLREFAINSYSHADDANDNTVIDPDYDDVTVAQLFKGKNLYDDYTLQNHNLFHTSYQNVVMQELGEAALALKLFQQSLHGKEQWKTNALMHNNEEVMNEVLNWLALADGELAMPNGNDWSLFLFDQITSYSTMACFLADPNALMLENMAYKYIKARQQTTSDGSWLLNADVGPRRMGVEAHRVMMTWLMHNTLSTASLTPTTWDDFNKAYSEARILPAQNIVRASTPERFTCFSWSTGLKSYTGYFAPNTPDNNKIIVPFRANNTGNLIGWYEVNGKSNNATPVVSGIYSLDGDAYTMNGELNTNDAALNHRFALYSTPGNAFIYIDYVRANADVTIKRELGGMLAISTDPFMKEKRTIYYGDGKHRQTDGKAFETFTTDWANIDNALGLVSAGDKQMAFGDRSLNNSIHTAKLYPLYRADNRAVRNGETVDARHLIYYSSIDAATTARMAGLTQPLASKVPAGWNGVIAPDPDGTCYLILANFAADAPCALEGIACAEGAPVFGVETTVADSKSSATFVTEQNRSVANVLRVFVKGTGLTAVQDAEDCAAAYIRNDGNAAAKPAVTIIADGKSVSGEVSIAAGKCVRVSVKGGKIVAEDAEMPETAEEDLTAGYVDVTASYIENAGFEEDLTYGKKGSAKLGSTVYDPCYINDVAAANDKYPNILPVKGWEPGNALTSATAYARMYSMPYSSTLMCVSEAGNYSAQCAPFLKDSGRGERVLTVLNSWSAGSNSISRKATLPAGSYRLLVNMKYDCPEQSANDGRKVTANGNVNKSLTGYKTADTEEYFYPTVPGEWQTICRDFVLTAPTDVTFSVGYSTSASQGVAKNTLLYVDNIRLLAKPGAAAIAPETDGRVTVDVYTVAGVKVRSSVEAAEATAGLAPGCYIVGDRKVIVR